ncbi:BBE domain-containing protein [Streptomyces sp. NPDC087420]|uniref:BBE domain-containing protein n=1 Tax=Streptomyces sp. NPDC087420 TaxID=3365785 RepID=UPI003838A1C7
MSLRLSYLGPQDTGKALIAPLRRAAPVLMDTVSEKPLTAFGSLSMDPSDPAPDRKAYAPDVYDRLRCVKALNDPDNTFRINHNIPAHKNA